MTPNPLLPLFKEQLEAECGSIGRDQNLSVRGHTLIYWYFKRLLRFSDADVAEVICDGAADLGIDAIWIDDDELVHFFQFKNPENDVKSVPGGEIDKLISGLRLILFRKHDQIANEELKARLDEVYSLVPKGYRIHIISSGRGIEKESEIKLNALVDELRNPSNNMVEWDVQSLENLQERFYQQNLPAVEQPVRFTLQSPPYMLRSGAADCYLFSVVGEILAGLYNVHKEGLLQRNIRVDQGDTATNRLIEQTCSTLESSNFIHYNNGVTFLCESANFDVFQKTLVLNKAQVVNGGQTIRALYRASQKNTLRSDVLVPMRAIASTGNKDFANNVAVNQNNQNQIGTGFLRSNDQFVVQLDHALASLGWYLERREGELDSATAEEKAAISQRISHEVGGRVIKLKEAAQAYTSTFYGQPEIAKKNVRKIFLSVEDGGYYERIFSSAMTAEKIIIAHKIKIFVDEFVRKFATIRRRVQGSDLPDIISGYETVLGVDLAEKHYDVAHQVMPQCSLFVCGLIYKDLVENQSIEFTEIERVLDNRGSELIRFYLQSIMEFARNNKDKADRSWPVLLKSNAFFSLVVAYVGGQRKGAPT